MLENPSVHARQASSIERNVSTHMTTGGKQIDIHSTVTTPTTTTDQRNNIRSSDEQQNHCIDAVRTSFSTTTTGSVGRTVSPPFGSSNEEIEIGLHAMAVYCRLNASTLKRGHLWLLPKDTEHVNAALAALNLSSSWAFIEVPGVADSPTALQSGPRLGRRSTSKKTKRKTTGSSSGASHRKAAGAFSVEHPYSSPSEVPARTSTQNEKWSRKLRRDKEAVSERAQKAFIRQFKSLPDWTRRLHRVTQQLCQADCAKPFTREPLPTDHDYSMIYDAIQPKLMPLGLMGIVTKLEHGGYATALEAFNDIYSVWLAAYRTHSPGSPLWIQAHEASRMFLQQISNEPLFDDFTQAAPGTLQPSTSIGSSVEDTQGQESVNRQASGSSSSARKKRSSTSVDKLFREFLEQHEGAGPISRSMDNSLLRSDSMVSSVLVGGNGGGTKKRILSSPGSQGGVRRQKRAATLPPPAPPITDQEREAFQNYLSTLEPHHHLMLYEAFRRTAVWRSVESGEVELDDARTTPPVFRKMISWCKSQVAVQQPLKQGQRRSAIGAFHEGRPPCTTATGPAAVAASSSLVPGSGKMVPGGGGGVVHPDRVFNPSSTSSSGGKLTATSYLESRGSPNQPISPKYSSSGSSSSTSSSNEEDSSDDDKDDDLHPLPPPGLSSTVRPL